MFTINYIKFDSMEYAIHYSNGKIKREGRGLSFYYWNRNSSIVCIPLKSFDQPFVFHETTSDYQVITVQGQLTYKIKQPKQLAEQLNFTIRSNKRYVSDDFEKLSQRLINEAQKATSEFVHSLSITEVLEKQNEIVQKIVQGLRESEVLESLGVEVNSVSVLGVRATPEMTRALETRTREALQQEADEAIYERRNFAVEQERKIRESELNTEIAVEEKEKQIVEKKMETDLVKGENERKLKEMKIATQISIEEKNKALVEMKVENEKKQAEAKEQMLKAVVGAYKELDWKVVMALQNSDMTAADNIALAFRELASNSDKIETLNITPDLLESLLNKK